MEKERKQKFPLTSKLFQVKIESLAFLLEAPSRAQDRWDMGYGASQMNSGFPRLLKRGSFRIAGAKSKSRGRMLWFPICLGVRGENAPGITVVRDPKRTSQGRL